MVYVITEPREFKVDLEIRFGLYIAFGIVTCITSFLCIIVFLSTRELRKKYIMFTAISVGDFLNGLSFVLAGTFRDEALIDNFYYKEVTGMDCLLRTPWGLMMVVAGQIPALLHLFVALDKIVAFRFINLYREQPIIFRKEAYVAMTAVLTVFFVIIAFIINIYHPYVSTNRMCAVMNSTGIYYGTVHFSLIAISYLFCFIVLWYLFHKINRSREPSPGELRRQNMILSLDLLSVILVSIPNLALILNQWGVPAMNPLLVGILYLLYAIHSAVPFAIYMHFRMDFRAQFLKMIGRRPRSAENNNTSDNNKSVVTRVKSLERGHMATTVVAHQ